MEETQNKNLIIGLIDKIIPPLNRPNSFNLTDVLDYTPDSLGPIYERFLSPENSGVGFKKTVRQDFDDFEGLGKGQIIISDDKEKGVVTKWSPYMGDEFYKEENRKGLQAEFAMNFPLHVFPWLAMATGAKTLVTRHQQNPTRHVSGRTTTLKPGDLTPNYGSKGKTYDPKTDQVRTGQPGITKNEAGIPVDTGQNQAYRAWLARNQGGTEQQWRAWKLATLSDLTGKVDGSGGFLKRLGNKIVGQKEEQPNIFTNPNTGKALPGFKDFKAAMDNEIEAFALSIIQKGNTGYKSLSEFRSKIVNRLDDVNKLRLYQSLAEGNNLQNGYIEHLIQKSDAMDWYWNMKGQDRNGLQNVRIAFDNRLKVLKDIAEGLVHGRKTSKGFKKGLGWQTDTLENRLIVSFEDPDVHSFVFNKQGLGNIVLRRAGSGKLVGKLGQYLSSLYPQDQSIAAQLDLDIRDYIRSNKITITVKTNTGNIRVRPPTVAEWKRGFLENRINIIIKDSHKLSGMSESERNTFIGDVINEDMVQLRQEFPFLPQEQTNPLGDVSTDLPLSETGYLKRGQDKNPIPPLGDPRFRVKEGPFKDVTKTDDLTQPDRPPGTPKSG